MVPIWLKTTRRRCFLTTGKLWLSKHQHSLSASHVAMHGGTWCPPCQPDAASAQLALKRRLRFIKVTHIDITAELPLLHLTGIQLVFCLSHKITRTCDITTVSLYNVSDVLKSESQSLLVTGDGYNVSADIIE